MRWNKTAEHTGHQGPVYALAAGRGATDLLSGSGDGRVVRWDLGTPDRGEVLVNVGQAVFALCTLGDHLLAVGTEGGGLHVVDLTQGRETHLFDVHRKGIFAMVPLPGRRFACAAGDGTLSIWGWHDDVHLIRHIPLVEEKLRGLALSPDGRELAVACGDGSVRVLETVYFNETHTIAAHPPKPAPDAPASTTGATAVAYHPMKPVLLSGGKDGHLRAWRTDQGYAPLLGLPAHKAGIYRIALHPEACFLASASRDKTAKLWDSATLDPIARLDRGEGGHTLSVNDVRWLGDTLLTASDDRRILAWRPARPE
jgi:WD40 repeat protein